MCLYVRDADEQMGGLRQDVRECEQEAQKVSTDLGGKVDNLRTQVAEVSNELKSIKEMTGTLLSAIDVSGRVKSFPDSFRQRLVAQGAPAEATCRLESDQTRTACNRKELSPNFVAEALQCAGTSPEHGKHLTNLIGPIVNQYWVECQDPQRGLWEN
eukprot:g1137.t1